jgi:hypothetical protein
VKATQRLDIRIVKKHSEKFIVRTYSCKTMGTRDSIVEKRQI